MKTNCLRNLIIVLIMISNVCFALAERERSAMLTITPSGWDNYQYCIYFYKNDVVFNTSCRALCEPGEVFDLKPSPAYNALAVLYQANRRKSVTIYSTLNGRKMHTFTERLLNQVAMAYSPNAKHFAIADDKKRVRIYNTKDYNVENTINTNFLVNRLSISSNNYFIAATGGNQLSVWIFETGVERLSTMLDGDVTSIAFSNDNTLMGVLSSSGKLYLYNTQTFEISSVIMDLGEAIDFKFHPDGKYVAVATASDEVTLINMKSTTQREILSTSSTIINHLGIAKTFKGIPTILYVGKNALLEYSLAGLKPDYTKLLADEVEEKMDEWLRRRTDETMEEYQLRVNEESRLEQYTKLENELSTKLAGNQIEYAEISMGNYNTIDNLLEVSFDNMPSIYLEVPKEDVASFSNPMNLNFTNSVYGVTTDDNFELIYTEVTNKETGKKYVFDNLEKQSLEFMTLNDKFVPLDLIQQSSMEENVLREIKKEVVQTAKDNQQISEHTHIDVQTKIEASVDEYGNKIMNYCIDFNYDVEEEFSAREDFAPGQYNIKESKSAMAMLQIIQQAFQNDFQQYISMGKKVKMIITGSADAAPVKGVIFYKNEYGPQQEALVTCNKKLQAITVTPQTGITTNEQLAYLRALGVQSYVDSNLPELQKMRCEYDYIANVSRERGAEFRRIGIRFVFIDAFNK